MLVQIDASEWNTPVDFLTAFRTAIGSPDWQGWSPQAFVDTIFWDGCNRLQPPYQILVTGTKRVPVEVADYIQLMAQVLLSARTEHTHRTGLDIDVTLTSDVERPDPAETLTRS